MKNPYIINITIRYNQLISQQIVDLDEVSFVGDIKQGEIVREERTLPTSFPIILKSGVCATVYADADATDGVTNDDVWRAVDIARVHLMQKLAPDFFRDPTPEEEYG